LYSNKKILTIIPARGGSKRLPRKNVKPLSGKPLIVWTIEQALLSKYLDTIIVSTDDKEIALISKNHGAEVPFLRPTELATDDTNGIDVVLHAMKWFEEEIGPYDMIVELQPTSPLRLCSDIDKTIELLFLKKAKAVVSVCKCEHHPLWSNTLPNSGSMKDFITPEIINKSRKNLRSFYRLNGAVYLAFWEYLKEKKNYYGDHTYAYEMPIERSVDIDNEFEFKFAEYIMQMKSD
jgi:N-acylneuraminate cytidylyltransferase/CMP-N,N'-diacetyllegionaminic acid synthase